MASIGQQKYDCRQEISELMGMYFDRYPGKVREIALWAVRMLAARETLDRLIEWREKLLVAVYEGEGV